MKYLLKSPYPCLIRTKNQEVELEPFDTLECDDEEVLFVYPLQQGAIPFCVNTHSKKDCDKFSFVRHCGQNLIILEKVQNFDVFLKENFKIGTKSCKITISSNKIDFETDKKIVEYCIKKQTKPPKIFTISSFVCASLENEFFAYDTAKEHLSHFVGDEISVDGNKLFVRKKMHDSAQRGKILEYRLENEITLINEKTLENTHPALPKNAKCYEFLENIMANDTKKCQDFLCQSLQEKIGEHEYGDFNKYFMK